MGTWFKRVFFWGLILGIMAVLAGQGTGYEHFVSQVFRAAGTIIVAAWHGVVNALQGHGIHFH
jgi:hypothetical protein